jgi:hypothetical protein
MASVCSSMFYDYDVQWYCEILHDSEADLYFMHVCVALLNSSFYDNTDLEYTLCCASVSHLMLRRFEVVHKPFFS